MKLTSYLQRIPLTLRVPAMVAILMVIISMIISERVLNKLYEMQEQHLAAVVGTYFDGLSTALMPAVLREDIWETYDILDRTQSIFTTVAPLETVVTGRDDKVIATSDPRKTPVLSPLPVEYAGRISGDGTQIDWSEHTGFGVRPLLYQGRRVGTVHASFDISHLVAERRQVLYTLLATNAVLALVFATAGYLIARRMVNPVKTLADHMRSGATGTPQPITLEEFPSKNGEFADLFHGFNALVEAQRQRSTLTQRLAEEEKLASLGRLASSMAHEINNPLGGLFNSIDTLKRHGGNADVRDASLSLLERGLAGIRDVVQAALATYRPDRSAKPLVVGDLEDVRVLAGPVISSRRQTLSWMSCPADLTIPALPGSAVRQALLNVVLNASAAAGDGGTVSVDMRIGAPSSTLILSVADSGPGLGKAAIDVLTSGDPWPASQAAGGLGLWMVRRMVDDVGGRVSVAGSDYGGALIELHLPISNTEEEMIHAA